MTAERDLDNLIPGIKGVLDLLKRSPETIESIFLSKEREGAAIADIEKLCHKHKIKYTLLEKNALNRMYPGAHQGVLARLMQIPSMALQTLFDIAKHSPLPLIIALDQVKDPGNVGAMARTLYALGGAGFILPKHNTAYLGAASLKASAGTLPLLTVSRVTNLSKSLEEAAVEGFSVYMAASATHEGNKENIFTFTPSLPAILVLGSEERGLRPSVQDTGNKSLYIPFKRDFDSLNVAQAAAIFMGEFSRHLKS